MNYTISQLSLHKTHILLLGLSLSVVVMLSTLSLGAATVPQLTSQIGLGSQGANVTSLQTFLAANPSMYPEGIVSGYYGSLTEAAVKRFQVQYGIDPVGRVGPLTLAKINSLITGGGLSGTSDMSGPQFLSFSQSVGANSATFTWTTNEIASAKVFYHTGWITMNEGDINSVGFGSTNGLTAMNDGLSRTNQQVVLTGLMPNTEYHFVVVSTDAQGNVSVHNPNATFRTTN